MTRRTIGICAVQAPFITGGAELLVRELATQLQSRGYVVDAINIPFKWYPVRDLVKQALLWRWLEVGESNGMPIDMVIATKFPSYLVRHPVKVTWLFHQHREVYDLYGTTYCSFTNDPEEQEIRQTIIRMDNKTLRESKAIYTISRNVSARLERYNGIGSTALYPPPNYVGRYRRGPFGDYFLFAGRLDPLKRCDLLIESFRYISNVKLVMVGTGPQRENLERQIERLGLQDRVTLKGFVAEEELLELYSGSCGVLYAPVDEDYGYVTVEAFMSGKPVITCRDSGGPLEFVEDDVNGLIVEPEPEAIADAVRRLDADRPRAREMGENGRPKVAGISWDHVVDTLTASLR